jgi:hypothetical protein
MVVFSKNKYKVIKLFVLVLIFSTCSTNGDDNNEENTNTIKPASISFVNFSGYKVDIYKNLNPQYFDPTTFVCTVNAGSTKIEEMYPSYDKVVGDAFYPRYKILLEDRINTGTIDIYVDAQRVLTNLTRIIESGKKYTIQVPHPEKGELSFFHGYIKVLNMQNTQIQILSGTSILPKMDDGSVFINAYKNGYYEIQFSYLDDTINMKQLKAFSSSHVNFPEFIMERGKLYSFTVNETNVIGPQIIKNIDPLNN